MMGSPREWSALGHQKSPDRSTGGPTDSVGERAIVSCGSSSTSSEDGYRGGSSSTECFAGGEKWGLKGGEMNRRESADINFFLLRTRFRNDTCVKIGPEILFNFYIFMSIINNSKHNRVKAL